MRKIVLDTNCLIQVFPRRSKFRKIWDDYQRGNLNLCVTTDILEEYEEIITRLTNPIVAKRVLEIIIHNPATIKITRYNHFDMLKADPDDNKFIDCAIAANAEYLVSNDRHFNILKDIAFPHVDVVELEKFFILNYCVKT